MSLLPQSRCRVFTSLWKVPAYFLFFLPVPIPAPTQITSHDFHQHWLISPVSELRVKGIGSQPFASSVFDLQFFEILQGVKSISGLFFFTALYGLPAIYLSRPLLRFVVFCKLGCFQLLTTTNKATMDHSFTNIFVDGFLFLSGKY